MRTARLLALASLAAFAVAAPALADAPADRLARVLASPGRPHPLADAAGRIPFTVALPKGQSAAALGLLEVAPGIGAARLDPAALAAFALGHPELALGYTPGLRPMLDVSGAWIKLAPFQALVQARTKKAADGAGVIVGVVDTGLDIFHPDFRDAKGNTRVAWLLTAGKPAGLHPDLEAKYGCNDPQQPCAVYAAADIDALIAAKDHSSIHDAEGHGTHVTSIAAGNGGVSIHKNPTYVGIAPKATLVIASPSASGGFADADVLNGARFVFDRADDLGMPVALNLSIGGDFGPHDGTSALEKGLSAFVGDDKPGRVVVVAAGNSGGLVDVGDGPASGAHTQARVTPGAITRVPIRASGAKKGQGFVWITFRPGDAVSVALEGPGGASWVGFTGRGEEHGYDDGKGTTAGVVDNHVSKTSSLTSDTNGAVVVALGAWPDRSEFAVLLEGSGDADLWAVGTGDVGPSSAIGFVFERAIREGTVTVPASAPGLLAVGCTLNRVTWTPLGAPPLKLTSLGGEMDPVPDGACYFSASGPTPFGVAKPEISAPGGFVAAAMSSEADPRTTQGGLFDSPGCPDPGVACFVVEAQHAIAAGTSMSAPHVTGAIALLLQLDPTLTQARATAIVQAGARQPTGHAPFDFQLGPGVLDLEGALQAMADEAATPLEPDLGKSWYTLASPYVRPDASWPVWGTIELRRADGSVASGLDGTKLAVTVNGGVLVQAPLRVRHGLFRFAIAGSPGRVGDSVTVEVTYGGASMGVRTLPIGTDAWNSDGVVGAVGGCALAPGGAGVGAGAGATMLAAALWLGIYRERRRLRARG